MGHSSSDSAALSGFKNKRKIYQRSVISPFSFQPRLPTTPSGLSMKTSLRPKNLFGSLAGNTVFLQVFSVLSAMF